MDFNQKDQDILQDWLSDWNLFVNKLHWHFGLLDPIGEVANILDNLHMKPSDKISTYNVNFMCYASQLGWGNSVLCYYYYQGLPNQIQNSIFIWEQEKPILFQNIYALAMTINHHYWAELFTIGLDIAKVTSMAIEYIILITDLLGSARWAVESSVYPRQAHSLTVCSALRSFFSQDHGYKIDFWDCFSKAEWSLHQLVHNDVTNTRISAGLHPATTINLLYSKSVISCLNTWRTSFNCSTIQGQYFLPFRDRNQQIL